ncbi:uncharacterized protein LOC144588055 [Pogona vitticeps]|uniref:Uncharacterized protein n=1 Tax=Pogona vitticeps TaxID=103695 RepID=A0ABM5GKR2_9SAUR
MPPPPSGPFSRCVVCSGKIPFQDGHDTCLFCLGESHSPQNCRHCQAFTKAALKARQQRLKLHLWDSALSASKPSTMELPSTASPPEPQATSEATVSELPTAPKPSKKPAKKASSSKAVPTKPPKKAKPPSKNKFSTDYLDAVGTSLPSLILDDASRDKESVSEATTSLPPRQPEPVLPLGVQSPTPSQLVLATTSLGLAPFSPVSTGRASMAHSISPSPSRASSPPAKKTEKKKHLSKDRRRAAHKEDRHRKSRRRRRSSSGEPSSSSPHRRKYRRRRRRDSSSLSSSSSSSSDRRHRRRRVKYVYLSSSGSTPPRRRRHRRKHDVDDIHRPVPLPTKPPVPPTLPAPLPSAGSAAPAISAPTVGVEHRPRKRAHESSSDDDQPFSSQQSGSDDDLPPQPTPIPLPVGETVESDTGDPHDPSPSEDFSSYSQMLSRLAKTLKLPVDEPPPPEEDLIFGDITKERTPPPSLSYLPSLLKIIKELWDRPSSSIPLPRRTENMYKIIGDDTKFLLKHPIPNSLIVETSCSKPTGRSHVIPTNKEGKKLEMIGRRIYSLVSFLLRIANYQMALGAYQKQLWLKLLPGLQLLPDDVRQGYLNTFEEAQTVSKHQRIATRHSVEAAARILVSSVTLRRHAWLRSANILDDVKSKIEDLPFDASGLFNEKTDSHLEDLHKAKKTAKSYFIQSQPKFTRYQWKRSPHQFGQSQPFRQFKPQSQPTSSQGSTPTSTYRGQPSHRRQSFKPPAKKHKQYL